MSKFIKYFHKVNKKEDIINFDFNKRNKKEILNYVLFKYKNYSGIIKDITDQTNCNQFKKNCQEYSLEVSILFLSLFFYLVFFVINLLHKISNRFNSENKNPTQSFKYLRLFFFSCIATWPFLLLFRKRKTWLICLGILILQFSLSLLLFFASSLNISQIKNKKKQKIFKILQLILIIVKIIMVLIYAHSQIQIYRLMRVKKSIKLSTSILTFLIFITLATIGFIKLKFFFLPFFGMLFIIFPIVFIIIFTIQQIIITPICLLNTDLKNILPLLLIIILTFVNITPFDYFNNFFLKNFNKTTENNKNKEEEQKENQNQNKNSQQLEILDD